VVPVSAMVTVTMLVTMTGCNSIDGPEVKCIKSERLNWKDPDSVEFITNLGKRGRPDIGGPNHFWVRYKGKNGYGGFGQENILCVKLSDGSAAREPTLERLAVLQTQLYLMANDAKGRRSLDQYARDAERLVYESHDDLPPEVVN